MYLLKILIIQTLLFFNLSKPDHNMPSPRTGPQDLLVTLRHSNFMFRNIHNKKNNLVCFQIYPETELAWKYTKPLCKTQYSEILVEYEQGFDMNTGKLIHLQWQHLTESVTKIHISQ